MTNPIQKKKNISFIIYAVYKNDISWQIEDNKNDARIAMDDAKDDDPEARFEIREFLATPIVQA